MLGHYFIHPITLLNLCRYFNVCVKFGQSPATLSVTLTVPHGQHPVHCSVTTIQFPSVLLFMFHFTVPLPYPHALFIQTTGDDVVEDADGSFTYG